MNLVEREIQKEIEKNLFKGKAIVLYGARRVGKTTLLKMIAKKHKDVLFLNCDEPDIRLSLSNKTSTQLKAYIGNHKMVIIDEAQRITDIGITIKLLVDNFPQIQIIASGSSSFDLSGRIKEPLTGRKIEFFLYPFSLKELLSVYSQLEIKRILEYRILYGMYPEIIKSNDLRLLKQISSDYLYKDILSYSHIRSHEAIVKLLQALALQIGQQVSFTELASLTGIDKKTVESYVEILEKSFVIFRLMPFSRNLRNELKKTRKIYFYDLGIRNALINNFNPLDLRQDKGQLWENFLISERVKYNKNRGRGVNIYFWRTHQGEEIDYLEDSAGEIIAFEFKVNKPYFKFPKRFLTAYPRAQTNIINKENLWSFLLPAAKQ